MLFQSKGSQTHLAKKGASHETFPVVAIVEDLVPLRKAPQPNSGPLGFIGESICKCMLSRMSLLTREVLGIARMAVTSSLWFQWVSVRPHGSVINGSDKPLAHVSNAATSTATSPLPGAEPSSCSQARHVGLNNWPPSAVSQPIRPK